MKAETASICADEPPIYAATASIYAASASISASTASIYADAASIYGGAGAGLWQVQVMGADIPYGEQRFAIVVTGAREHTDPTGVHRR